MPRDTSNSGRTGMGGSMSGGGGSSSGSRGAGGGGNGGWGGAKRGADGMTASQRAQTRDSRLGMKTGTTWQGNTAFGRPGQMAQGFTNIRPSPGFGMGPVRQPMSNPGGPAMTSAPPVNRPVPAGAPPPGQSLMPHSFPGLAKPMLPGLFGGGVPPYQYTSMGPWPGQSAIPNNPPVYKPGQATTRPAQTWSVEGGNGVTGLTGLSLPGYGKQFSDRVPQGNNIQSGSGWLNNGWGGYGWNKNGSGGGFGGGGGGGW